MERLEYTAESVRGRSWAMQSKDQQQMVWSHIVVDNLTKNTLKLNRQIEQIHATSEMDHYLIALHTLFQAPHLER